MITVQRGMLLCVICTIELFFSMLKSIDFQLVFGHMQVKDDREYPTQIGLRAMISSEIRLMSHKVGILSMTLIKVHLKLSNITQQ